MERQFQIHQAEPVTQRQRATPNVRMNVARGAQDEREHIRNCLVRYQNPNHLVLQRLAPLAISLSLALVPSLFHRHTFLSPHLSTLVLSSPLPAFKAVHAQSSVSLPSLPFLLRSQRAFYFLSYRFRANPVFCGTCLGPVLSVFEAGRRPESRRKRSVIEVTNYRERR